MFGLVKGLVAKEKAKKEFWLTLQNYLNDGELSSEEKSKLEKLAKNLGLSPQDLHAIYKKASNLSWQLITSDGKITDEEKETFEGLLKYFGVEPKETDFNQAEFNKFYTLGLIDKGILPEIKNHDVDVIFKKDEKLHWACPAVLRQHKRVVQRVSYGGPRASIRIAKGLSYRIGSYNVQTQSKEIIAPIDSGTFWITSMRIGFMGSRKNFSVPINKIAYVHLLSEGLLLAKDGRENPYLLGLNDYEVPAAEISLLLNQAG